MDSGVPREDYEALLLSPAEQYMLTQLRMEMSQLMSALTDQVDAALAQLASDTDALDGVIQAQQAANAVLQNALTASQNNEVADEAELQKALDALNAANEKLAGLAGTGSGGSTTPDPTTPDPTDPGTVTDPGTAGDGTGSGDGGTVVTGDPGTDPGTVDPGTTDPGTVADPGTDPGTVADPGTTDPSTDPAPAPGDDSAPTVS